MPKRKKTGSSYIPKKKVSSGIRSHIFTAIQQEGKNASLSTIFPKLIKQFGQEEIILALNSLDKQGKIQISKSGGLRITSDNELVADAQTVNSHAKKHTSEKREFKRDGNFLYGKVDLTKGGAAFVAVDGLEKDVYISHKHVRTAMQGDEVKIRITVHGRRPEGEIVQIVKRSQDTFSGKIEVLDKFAFFVADDRKMSTDVFVPLNMLNGAKHNQRVIVRVTEWNTGTKNPLGEVLEVIQNRNSSDFDMKQILFTNGFSIDFPRAVYDELAPYTDEIPAAEVKKRLDLRAINTFTIDPVDAKDFDDAISVQQMKNGHYEIGVHIADVSHFVREGSALDKEAERRATSVYLPDRVCPMLPEKLSNQLCSLRPKEDKLTFSTIFEFDQSLNIVNYTIAKTIIHSKRRFTYEEAQEVLETGSGDFVDELGLLHSISKKMRAQRMKDGAIAFEKAEVRFKLDETGKPLGIVLKIRKDAHLLVEDFMLLANETVAKFGAKLKVGKHKVPFVYRVHDAPDPAKLEQFSAIAARFGYHIKFDKPENAAPILNALLKKVEGRPEQNVLETMAIRSMSKAAYTTTNIGHYGLAMKHYTHFTSPIRRYPDVLAHRILFEMQSGSDKIIDKDELETRCKNSSFMERKAMEAEREATKYKQIEFLQDKIGEEFAGIITGVISRGIFVEMDENKCEGMVSTELLGNEDFTYDEKMVRLTGIRSGKRYQIGEPVKVRILNADIELRRIDLELAEDDTTKR
ncbi:MAG: ribonuclease R [Chitinophagales bacterium]|nr:ribonuclease R [Chitinophagales bacterium]